MVDADESPIPAVPKEFTLDRFYVHEIPTTVGKNQFIIEQHQPGKEPVSILIFAEQTSAYAVRKELNRAYRLGITDAISHLLRDVEVNLKLQKDMDNTNADRTQRHP